MRINPHMITIIHADRPVLTAAPVPQDKYFTDWVLQALEFANIKYPCEINIRTVEPEEMTQLNSQYRHKPQPTNVLAFPLMAYDEKQQLPFMGDIIICSTVVFAEAEKQHKQLIAHWAHLTIHGTLHLVGYTHDTHTHAIEMESLEKDILAHFNFPDPYSPTQRAYV